MTKDKGVEERGFLGKGSNIRTINLARDGNFIHLELNSYRLL